MSGVRSVAFKVDGHQLRTENVVPYSAGGDVNGYYSAFRPGLGNHTLTATPYSESYGGGVAGNAIVVSFSAINGSVSPTPTPNPTPTATPRPSPTATPTPAPTPVTSVTLAWNASSSSGVAGYHVSVGSASHSYTQQVNAGNRTSALITGLTSNKTYYFAVSAYNASGAESALSNEVKFTTVSQGGTSSGPTPGGTPRATPPSGSGSQPDATSVPTPRNANSPFLENLSARIHVGTRDEVGIVGFAISGSGRKTVVIRALGPSLARFGIEGVLADPSLEIHNSAGNIIASNDNWPDVQRAAFAAGGQYYAFKPGSNSESALVLTLPSGTYTAVVSGKNGSQGISLAEVYDFSQDRASTLTNISTRAQVMTGESVLIGGITIRGSGNLKIVLRAIGPTLEKYRVAGSLKNPTMGLYNSNGTLIHSSVGWRADASQASQLMTNGYSPPDWREPAMLTFLPPGSYTAVVHGENNTTGIALFDAYALN